MKAPASLKAILARTGGWPLVRHALERRTHRTLNVVYYHYVGESKSFYREFYRGCTLERFRQDLKFLSGVFQFVSLEELLAHNRETEDPAIPRLALTFDDGFDLGRREILQILDEFKVKATTLVITSCLDNAALMWRNKLSVIRAEVSEDACVREFNALLSKLGHPPIARGDEMMNASLSWDMSRKDELVEELWRKCGLRPVGEYLDEHRPYFSWRGLRDWLDAGHAVGLHTRTHPRCSGLDAAGIEKEIVEPARELKKNLGLGGVPFSYPFGDRLGSAQEQKLFETGVVTCAFGIRGFARRGSPDSRLERQSIEESGASWPVLAHALARSWWS